MTGIEQFIRKAARARGIDPDVAVRAARTEGGVDEPARLGDFSGPPWFSGKSWWPFQLHYGGIGTPYEAWGHTAGMGNDFTALTGWRPGDPRAWRDSVRYALNRVKAGGWGPWYGPATVGIAGFTGVDLAAPWDAATERWDYEDGVTPMPGPTYDPTYPAIAQNDAWSCAPTSLRWALWAFERKPSETWIEQTMIAEGVVSQASGLLDASGAGLAAFVKRQYGEFGYDARNNGSVTFDDVASVAGRSPVLLGGRRWGDAGHWSGVRGYDATADVLLLANPASGYGGVTQTMTRQQFDQVAPASMVVITNSGTNSPAAPVYAQPGDVGPGILSAMASNGTSPAAPSTFLPLGRSPAIIEECVAMSGELYRWHLPTGTLWRYKAA